MICFILPINNRISNLVFIIFFWFSYKLIVFAENSERSYYLASTRRFNRYAKYTPYAPSRAFSHWRCINGRTECIAMHSRIIQEDIADSTRGRELVETKVRLARTALLSSISRISLIPNSMDAPVILMYYAILMCTNVHTH